MSLLHLISDVEKDMISFWIDECGPSDEYHRERTASIPYLLREWDCSKSKYLSKMFGDNLILSKEIKIEKSYDTIEREMYEKIHHSDENFWTLIHDIENLKWNSEFENNRNIYMGLSGLTSLSEICANRYSGPTFELPILNSGKSIKIQTGAKVIKTLSKIVDAYGFDKELMEDFRIAHSQVLNQRFLNGKLCLSIHPMDYMTMSDNDCGWSSCMSWSDNGCYRQGTVEMMNSPMVVVAYLKAKDDMNVGDFTWANKKWRELFIVTPEMISNVKAYPYKHENLTTQVLKWLKELAEDAGIGTYDDDITNWSQDGDFYRNEEEYHITTYTDNMYNDFSENQLAFFGEALNEWANEWFEINYSGASECMMCGSLDPDLSSEGYVVGQCCDTASYCDNCGERHSIEDLIEIDGYYYCPDCYEDCIQSDDLTGEVHASNTFERIYLTDKDGLRALTDTHLVIETMVDNIFNQDVLKDYIKGEVFTFKRWHYTNCYCIHPSQLTDYAIKNLFGGKEEFEENYKNALNWFSFSSDIDNETTKRIMETIRDDLKIAS